MIWEQHVLVVVMTTRVVERGRTKCGQYWPAEEREVATHGDFTITTQAVQQMGDYTYSQVLINNNKVTNHFLYILAVHYILIKLQTEESRELSHLQFLAWPDYGVPHTATAMINFLGTVREQQNRLLADLGDTWAGHPRGPPIIVHCSAGIGRTGTSLTFFFIHF
jgi:tyrosine-protein phosphatase non-receptor type 9